MSLETVLFRFSNLEIFQQNPTDIRFDAEFHSHVYVSVSFFHRITNYTEKTNTYKNQIILSMLSASNLVDKNCVTGLHFFI